MKHESSLNRRFALQSLLGLGLVGVSAIALGTAPAFAKDKGGDDNKPATNAATTQPNDDVAETPETEKPEVDDDNPVATTAPAANPAPGQKRKRKRN